MVRVLHLVSLPATLHAAYATRDAGHEVRTLGRGGDFRNVADAVLGLRRTRHEFDLIHAWDDPALDAARWAGAPIVWTPAVARVPGWVRQAGGRRVHAACLCEANAAILRAGGWSGSRCHVVGVSFDGSATSIGARDTELRRALGFAEDDFVLLAAGESDRYAGHDLAVHATSILHVLDRRYRVLLWGRGGLSATVDLGPKLRQPGLVLRAEQRLRRPVEFEAMLAAADAGFYTARAGADPLPMLMMRGAGLPVIATDDSGVEEFARGDAAIRTAPRAPRIFAQLALDIAETPLARNGPGRVSMDYLSIYERVAGARDRSVVAAR